MQRRPFIAVTACVAMLTLEHACRSPIRTTKTRAAWAWARAFYGQFAPEQRAFVSQAVIERSGGCGRDRGLYLQRVSREKEGGSIPAPVRHAGWGRNRPRQCRRLPSGHCNLRRGVPPSWFLGAAPHFGVWSCHRRRSTIEVTSTRRTVAPRRLRWLVLALLLAATLLHPVARRRPARAECHGRAARSERRRSGDRGCR